MRKLPNVRRRRPSQVRNVKQPYYKNGPGKWSGFRQKNNYAVRWTGSLSIKKAGGYTFWTYSDDGSKLWIDNKQVVNNDGLHGWRGKSGRKTLSAGAHSFKAEMFERGGWHGMEVKYKGGDTRNRVVRMPASAFTAAKPKPKPAPRRSKAGGLKEEIFYNIRNMRKLPNVRRRRPSQVRNVKQPYYKNGPGKWSGFRQKNNYAVRWTGSLSIKKAGSYTFW